MVNSVNQLLHHTDLFDREIKIGSLVAVSKMNGKPSATLVIGRVTKLLPQYFKYIQVLDNNYSYTLKAFPKNMFERMLVSQDAKEKLTYSFKDCVVLVGNDYEGLFTMNAVLGS